MVGWCDPWGHQSWPMVPEAIFTTPWFSAGEASMSRPCWTSRWMSQCWKWHPSWCLLSWTRWGKWRIQWTPIRIPSGYVKIAIENDHRNSGFSHEKWWFSIAMLNYQRVYQNSLLIGGIPMFMKPQTALVVAFPFHHHPKFFFFGSNSSEIPNSPNSRSSFQNKVLLFRYHLPAPFALPTARWPGSCWRSASVSWVSRSTQRSSYRKCSATRACASCASKSPWSGCGWLGDGWGTKATKDGVGKKQKVDGVFQVLLGWSWLFWSLLHNLHMGLFQMEVFQDIVATTLAGVLCCQSGISTAGGLNPHEELRPNRTKLLHQGILSGWLPSGKLT